MNDLGCYRISEGLLYKFYDAILSKTDGVPSVFFLLGRGVFTAWVVLVYHTIYSLHVHRSKYKSMLLKSFYKQ